MNNDPTLFNRIPQKSIATCRLLGASSAAPQKANASHRASRARAGSRLRVELARVRERVFVAQREDVNGGGPEGPITRHSVLATGHRGGARTHLPGASRPSSRARARGDAGRRIEKARTSLRDSRRHLWECDTSFSSDALLRFRIVTQPSFSRVRIALVHPDKGNQCQCALRAQPERGCERRTPK